MPLQDLPPDARPREKLLARGPGALSDVELLALLLRTGIKGKGVLQMAHELLQIKSAENPNGFDGFAGLLHASAQDLQSVKGLGPAKRAELVGVLELARRAMGQQLRERAVFATPEAVKHYLQLHLAAKPHEVFAVLFLDVQNRLLAMEELFRGTLTQTSVYPREVVLRAFHGYPVREPTLVADSFVPRLQLACVVGGRAFRARSHGYGLVFLDSANGRIWAITASTKGFNLVVFHAIAVVTTSSFS
jgi:DNA repair protein RadC